jgi:hypothetical protein
VNVNNIYIGISGCQGPLDFVKGHSAFSAIWASATKPLVRHTRFSLGRPETAQVDQHLRFQKLIG